MPANSMNLYAQTTKNFSTGIFNRANVLVLTDLL